jgi:hypothetical protein
VNTGPLSDLAARWREEAARFRDLGLEQPAVMQEAHADELEERLREWSLEPLSLEEAAAESGFSYSKLQHDVRSERIPNAGRPGAPRIRRCDLPLKSKSPAAPTEPDLAARVLGERST